MDLTSDRVGQQSFLIFAHFCCLFRFFYPRPSMISLVSPHSFQPDPLVLWLLGPGKVGPGSPWLPSLAAFRGFTLNTKLRSPTLASHSWPGDPVVEGRQNHRLGVFPQLLKTDQPQPVQKQPAALLVSSFPKSWGAIR